MLFRVVIGLLMFFVTMSSYANLPKNYFNKAMKESSLDRKITNLSIAIKLDQSFEEAYLERAKAYFQKGNIGSAVKDLRTISTKFTPNAESLVLEGKIAERAGRLTKAGEYYDNALTLSAKHPEANFRKGLHLVTLAKLKSSEKLFGESIPFFEAVDENSEFIIFALSQAVRCYEHQNDFENAQNSYERLCRLQPKNSFYLFNYGRLLYMNGKPGLALDKLERTMTLTFEDRTNNPFYGLFYQYLSTFFADQDVAGEYRYKGFIEKIPDSLLKKMLLKEITIEEYLKESLSDKKKLSAKRKITLRAEVNCQVGYYYLIQGDKKKAMDSFLAAIQEDLFGLSYFYLSKYEYQNLKVSGEIVDLEKKK